MCMMNMYVCMSEKNVGAFAGVLNGGGSGHSTHSSPISGPPSAHNIEI